MRIRLRLFMVAALLAGLLIALPAMALAGPYDPNFASAAYSTANPFWPTYGGQCTWFAWGRTDDKLGIALGGSHGNAGEWWTDPGLAGFARGSTPLPNSIAVWRVGAGPDGHVAFIEDVVGSQVVLNEANYHRHADTNFGGGYDGAPEWVNISAMPGYVGGSYTLMGYIYVGGTTPVDTTPPTKPLVNAPSQTDDPSAITASWSSSDPETGISEYQYAVGTTPGGTDVAHATIAASRATPIGVRSVASAVAEVPRVALATAIQWQFPVSPYAITGFNFPGPVQYTDGSFWHLGEDAPASAGTAIHAAADGVVRFSGNMGTFGRVVILEHADGVCSLYGHLASSGLVGLGSTITRGTVVGYAGTFAENGGWAEHLHWGIHSGGFGASQGAWPSWAAGRATASSPMPPGWLDPSDYVNAHSGPVDVTPPTTPAVSAPSETDDPSAVTASWSSSDPETGVSEYQYAVGTTPGGTDVAHATVAAASTVSAAASDVSAAAYSADNIISDSNFQASGSMSAADVQVFLDGRPGALRSWIGPDKDGVGRTAASIIALAAQGAGVSPRVLITKLQCEKGLIYDPAPSQAKLDGAMGVGYYDSGTIDPAYQGFGKQVWYGAQTLNNNRAGWSAGIALTIDGTSVHPVNASTYSLYRYTPHLAGNSLFFDVYSGYFGDPTSGGTTSVAPAKPTVFAPSETDDPSAITASWSTADPGTGGLAEYKYSVATAKVDAAASAWVSAGKNTSVRITGLNLQPEITYYVSVKAVNGAGLESVGVSGAVRLVGIDGSIQASILKPSRKLGPRAPSYEVVTGPGAGKPMSATSGSGSQTFTTSKPGLVAIRYDYSDSPSTVWYMNVDGTGLSWHTSASESPVGEKINYVFLPAGQHTLSYGCDAGATTLEGISIGLSSTVRDAPVATIDTVAPASSTASDSVSFSGHGSDSLGHAITGYGWKSSIDGTISTAASFSTTSLSVGTHTILFKVQCASGTWSPTVTTTVSVYPDITTATITAVAPNPVTQGESVSFTGTGADSRGHAITGYQWRSSIAGNLSTSASFSSASLSVGTHTIYFKVQCSNGTWSPEVSTTLVVNVPPPDITTATITAVAPNPAVEGTSVAFLGSGTDSRGHAITGYQWRSSRDGVLSTAASFSTTALTVGTHTVYYKVQCSSGTWSPEKQATLVVTARPPTPGDTVEAFIDAAGPTPVLAGAAVSFTGHGTDSLGHAFSAYNWRSSRDGALSTAASFSTTSLSAGTHTIYFKAQCSNGTWSPEKQTTVVVNGIDGVTAAIDSFGPSPVTVGIPMSFSGHATDALGHSLSAYEWRSSIGGVLSTAQSFSTSALAVGTHTISFKARCASGVWSPEQQVTVVVNAAPVGARPTALTLSGPATCAFGSATLAVSLKDAASSVWLSRDVDLQTSTDGVTWLLFASIRSGAAPVSVPVAPTRTTRYRLVYTGESSYAPSTSAELVVKPKASVGTPSVPKSVRKNRSFAVAGALSPAHVGSRCAKVYLYRFERGHWRSKSSVWANATASGYRVSIRFSQTGRWRIRAYHASDADNGAAWSGYRNLTVK